MLGYLLLPTAESDSVFVPHRLLYPPASIAIANASARLKLEANRRNEDRNKGTDPF